MRYLVIAGLVITASLYLFPHNPGPAMLIGTTAACSLAAGHGIVAARALITAWRRRIVVGLVILPVLIVFAWVAGVPMPWQIPTSILLVAALVAWRRYGDTAGLVTRWGETARRKSGVASDLDILRHGSALALRRKVGVLRPEYADLSRWQKLRVPAREFATPIAKVGTARQVWASVEDVLLIFGGPRRGKALALDTPVPTPTGWTTMGALQDGDAVYDEEGRACRVVRAHDIRYERPCYEVVFSDGSVIVADAEHLWQVETRTSRKHNSSAKVLATEDMLGAVRVKSDGRANYSIPTARPLEAPEVDLPIAPYTLGAWLGDGAARQSVITLGVRKAVVLDGIRADGYEATEHAAARKPTAATYTIRGLTASLREADLLHNKHIPAAYFRASEQQRRALLAGLLDTDGWCEKDGNSKFGSTCQRLAEDVRSLIATLGYTSTIRSRPARLYGRDCGTFWEVTFCPDQPVFRVEHKANRQSTYNKASNKRRFVVDIRPVDSVPVRCITVDSPSSLYLVGDQCIATHNTGWLAGRILDACGAVIAASTRADLITLTWQLRSLLGPVMVFDAVGHGGANHEVPTSAFVQFDPLTGCDDPNGAAERAADLISAGRSDGGSDSERDYWYLQGSRVLEAMLHAAALGGRTMSDVLAWVADPEQHRATMSRYLRLSRQTAYVQDIAQFCETNDKTRSSITSTIMPALGWLTSPAATAAATPGATLDVEHLIRSRTTLYLLGEKETKSGPLVAAVNGYIVREARRIANRQPTGRLDPTLTMVCDEAGQLAPPLEDLTADMGGRGVQIIAAFQSHAQMLDRWSHDQAAVIMNNAGTVVVFGGTKDNADRKYWSELCGERDEVIETTDPMGKVKTRTVRKVPVFAPAIIGGLPDKRVIVIHTGMPPVVGKVQMAWDRRDYRRMRKELAGATTWARIFTIPTRQPAAIPADQQTAA